MNASESIGTSVDVSQATSTPSTSTYAPPSNFTTSSSAPTTTSSSSADGHHQADQVSSASASSITSGPPPDVVANPSNTSLLWSNGIADDRDPTSNFNPKYAWVNNSLPSNINTYPIAYYFSSNHAGDYVNFLFQGHGLSILDYQGPNRGRYNVSVDNFSVIVDAYSPVDRLASAQGTALPPAIWTSPTLAEGSHSVVITNLNDTVQLQFWGAVINPENYIVGKSFAPPASQVKTIVIASSVSAAAVTILFVIIGSILYYCKIVRPKRRLRAQVVSEKDDNNLLSQRSINKLDDGNTLEQTCDSCGPRPDLRLDVNFDPVRPGLSRMPSRVTTATRESQFWVRPDTGASPDQYRYQTRNLAASNAASSSSAAPPSPLTSTSPLSEYSYVSPLSDPADGSGRYTIATSSPPASSEYQTALAMMPPSSLSSQPPSSSSPPLPQPPQRSLSPPQQPSSQSSRSYHTYSHSVSEKALLSASSSNHVRTASTPISFTDPFTDPESLMPSASLQRSGTRRPLPIPPASQSSFQSQSSGSPLRRTISPVPEGGPTSSFMPAANAPRSASPLPTPPSQTQQSGSSSVPDSNSAGRAEAASSRVRVETDAGSIFLPEDDDAIYEDDPEAPSETVLPPPYSPRRMGQDYA